MSTAGITLPDALVDIRGNLRKWGLRAISVSLFLVVWEIVGRGMFLIAPPSEILFAFIDQLFIEQTLTIAILGALRQGVIGFVLAVLFGVPIGFLIGFWDPARDVLNPIIDALYVTPLVAFVPLFIVWFGLTPKAKIFLVLLLSIFVVIINTEAGVTETPSGLVDAARVFGASERRIYTEVHLRHSLPYTLTGVRLAAGRAVRGMVVAELFVYSGKLGSYLVDSGATFQIAKLFAGIAALSLLGVLVLESIEAVEKRLLNYRPD